MYNPRNAEKSGFGQSVCVSVFEVLRSNKAKNNLIAERENLIESFSQNSIFSQQNFIFSDKEFSGFRTLKITLRKYKNLHLHSFHKKKKKKS